MLLACNALYVQVVLFVWQLTLFWIRNGVVWQERYADCEGTKQMNMLQNWFDGKEFSEKWYVVERGQAAHLYGVAQLYRWFKQDFVKTAWSISFMDALLTDIEFHWYQILLI